MVPLPSVPEMKELLLTEFLAPCIEVSDETKPFYPVQMLLDQMASLFPTLKFPVHLGSSFTFPS